MTHLFTCWYRKHVHFVYIAIHSPATSFIINLLTFYLHLVITRLAPFVSAHLKSFHHKVKKGGGHSPQRFWCILKWLHHTVSTGLSASHPWCKPPVQPHSKGAYCDLLSVEAIWVQWTQITQKPQCERTWPLWHGTFFCWKRPPEHGYTDIDMFSNNVLTGCAQFV